MSILVEIAERAEVPLESVVRVLTREPVSSTVKMRVLAVLDQLDPEQTRVLERFALAAVHDVVRRESEDPGEGAPRDGADARQPALRRPAASARAADQRDQQPEPELPVGLGTLLEELVSAVWEIRHENRSDRQERLDDLAVLVDLMTTSWQGVDRRLGQLEQLVARREAQWRTSAAAGQFERSIRQPILEAAPPPPPPAADVPPQRKRSWPPFAGTLLLLVGLIGLMLVFDLLPSRPDRPSFLPASENGAGTQTMEDDSPSTQPGLTQPGAAEPGVAAPNVAPATTAPGGATTQPGRVFVWPAVEGAAAYSARFFRDGKPFYSARVSEPRLKLPKRIVFEPGAYRWVVRPVTGTGADWLGSPIIDSRFSVAKP